MEFTSDTTVAPKVFNGDLPTLLLANHFPNIMELYISFAAFLKAHPPSPSSQPGRDLPPSKPQDVALFFGCNSAFKYSTCIYFMVFVVFYFIS